MRREEKADPCLRQAGRPYKCAEGKRDFSLCFAPFEMTVLGLAPPGLCFSMQIQVFGGAQDENAGDGFAEIRPEVTHITCDEVGGSGANRSQ